MASKSSLTAAAISSKFVPDLKARKADMQQDIHRWVGMLWVGFLALWFIAAFAQKRTVRRESVASRLSYVSVAILAVLLLTRPDLTFGVFTIAFLPQTLFCALLGLGLTIAGFAFAIWARVHLGRNWSGSVTIKRDHELIRTGPYAIVRHPIYTGALLALLGTSIVFGDPRWLLGFGLSILMLRLKSRREEQFMTEQFGAKYEQYKDEVKALVPFVW